ncbi:MAG: (2Fe-2S)-binding protein [Candidatus Moduliflexus flocculans]|nr:(2Fe-2S)-binding protein [Candidatus Moduliflexus flocculans]
MTAGEIRRLIREGVRDISEIKAVTRAGMGSCGAKTCTPLVHRLFREEGVPEADIVDQPKRAPVHGGAAGRLRRRGRAGEGRKADASDASKRPSTLYDVIVVGAGSVGTPAAMSLAGSRPARSSVLDQCAERRPGLEQGAIGGIRATHSDPAKIRLCLRSPRDLLDLGGAPRRRASSGSRAATCFVAYRARRSGRSRSSSPSRRPAA